MEDLLLTAAAEIRELRRRNELLAAKVDVMDLFRCVLFTQPSLTSYGESEDIAWKLDQKVEELKAVKPVSSQ